MLNKYLYLLAVVFLIMPVCGMPYDDDWHVGTPAGFYDDINPDTLDDDDDGWQTSRRKKQQKSADAFTPPASVEKVKPTKDYAQIYNSLSVPSFSYLHDIDPEQYYDMKDATWSIYPLFRLMSPIYFKNIAIEPGYYLLTPREHKGEWYMLFKQNGLVKHIIPVYERDYTPEKFYDEHIPKPKLTPSQKIHIGFLDFIGKMDSTKRKTPVQTYLEVNDLDNYFVSVVVYYGGHKYSTIFRTARL